MPQVDIKTYEAMTPEALENRRAAIILKCKGTPTIDWDLDDLHEMAAIVGILRRRVSGPPKAKAPPKGKKEKAEMEDLL